MATYKAGMRPALQYASSIWLPLASSTRFNILQVMQIAALRTATGCTQDTSIQHLHDETLMLSIHEHLQVHASQYKQKTQHPSHPLHTHSHRSPHSHDNRDINTHASFIYIHLHWRTTSGKIGLPPSKSHGSG